MKNRKIHYAGSVRTPKMRILAGWAACCSGDRADGIRAEGAHTRAVSAVTCKACLRMMAKDPSIDMGHVEDENGTN